ncbi:hypothetical protein ACHAPT_007316 [Fusarium lateritium]
MDTLKPLPDLDGPKLEPFGHDMAADDVEFLQKVRFESAHGQVLKIRIGGDKCYALKIFSSPTIMPSTGEYEAGPTSTMSREEFEQYFTPFENECRAFGRLKELGREHLAVKAYGYVVLPNCEALDRKMRPLQPKYNRPDQIAAMTFFQTSGGEPCMGIVKDWVERVTYDTSITDEEERSAYDGFCQVRHFPRMLKNLHELHESGIVVRDLAQWQYMDGVLVDLSLASTMPHPFGPGRGWKPRWTFQSWAAWDLHAFQTNVIEYWRELASVPWDTPHAKAFPKTCSLRAYESQGEARELRPRPDRQRPFLPLLDDQGEELDMVQLPRHDPGLFDPEQIPYLREKKRKGGDASGEKAKKRKGVEGAPKGRKKSAAFVEELARDADEAESP